MTRRAQLLTEIGLALLSGVLGAGIGVITTFTHRQLPPWGLIAGVLIVGALICGLRLASEGRLAAAAAAIGVLLAIGVLSLQTSGGSTLVADDTLGIVWAIVPPIVSAIIVAWPRPRPRPEAPVDSE